MASCWDMSLLLLLSNLRRGRSCPAPDPLYTPWAGTTRSRTAELRRRSELWAEMNIIALLLLLLVVVVVVVVLVVVVVVVVHWSSRGVFWQRSMASSACFRVLKCTKAWPSIVWVALSKGMTTFSQPSPKKAFMVSVS